MCPGVVQVRELEVQEEAKDREVGLSHRDRGFRTREEAVFPAHTTGFWSVLPRELEQRLGASDQCRRPGNATCQGQCSSEGLGQSAQIPGWQGPR